MQVRQILISSILVANAVGAMSQEIDRSETLQAKSFDAQQAKIKSMAEQANTAVVVVGQAQSAKADDQTKVTATPDISWASRHAKHLYAKTWLHADKRPPVQVAAGPRA